MAIAIALVALAACRDLPTEVRQVRAPASPRTATFPSPGCFIKLDPPYNLTDNTPNGGACSTSWSMFVPWIFGETTNQNGFYWPEPTQFVTGHLNGGIQNGPLVINFSPAVRSARIFVRNGDTYMAPGPAGLRITAVNNDGDTLAVAISDGVNSSFIVEGKGMTQVVIWPVKIGTTDSGNDRVAPTLFQVEYEPIPCSTWDIVGDDPDVRAFLKTQSDISRANGDIERSGPLWKKLGAFPPIYEGTVTTKSGASQCWNEFTVGAREGWQVVGTWHTHSRVNGTTFDYCPQGEPTSKARNQPSTKDYKAQEDTGVPLYIIDLDEIIIIQPHGTDHALRPLYTEYYSRLCTGW